MSTLLSANEIRLYGYQNLLDGVTLAVSSGEKVGLVGRNGCGKTSLLKILAGENQPDSGEVSTRRTLRIGYLPQELELDPEISVHENIASGAADVVEAIRRYENGDGSDAELAELLHLIEHADGWNLDARIQALTNALDAPPLASETGPLSGGEKRRVALCRALASQPDLLLLDEPTNHLDADSIRWLEDFLKSYTGAVIFVTHDRYFLDLIATRIVEIDHGKAYSHPGNYTAFLESKAVRRQVAEQTERRRQRFLREELDWVRAGVKARTTKSRHRLDKFYEIEGMKAPPEEREMDLLIPPPPDLGNTVVELEQAGVKVGTEASPRWLFRRLDLKLEAGQCTGIVGRNGAGKTTLLKVCLGRLAPSEGSAIVGKRVRVNYIDQTRMVLDGTGSLLDEVGDGSERVQFGDQVLGARAYLRRFLFSDERINERVDLLSGGERARLMLAKVLKSGGNLLVLDEPTNDLDLPSLRMLEEAIADFAGSVLVVSHDRYFLDRICDQIIAFEDGGVHITPGNYSYYLEKRQERENAERADVDIDMFELVLGDVLVLTAQDFHLDTGAGPEEFLVQFGSIGAEVRIGSLVIGGEARNFGFLGDGTFAFIPGTQFAVILNVGSTSGGALGWPSWLPIKINTLGVEFADILEEPDDFTLILSASVDGLPAVAGLEFSGAIEGVRIRPKLLAEGKFPIVSIDAFGVSVSGSLFGGEINAALVGGILVIVEDNTAPEGFRFLGPTDDIPDENLVEDRVLFVGLQGGFSLAGLGGLTIRLALSELGPLGVFLNVEVPGGILLEPNTGLSMNDFSAGVEFFKTLPSIEDPFAAERTPQFGRAHRAVSRRYLAGQRQAVRSLTQYLADQGQPEHERLRSPPSPRR